MPKTTTVLLAATVLTALGAKPALASTNPTTNAFAAKPKVSLCEPVPVKTFHGTRMEAYCRLARIENGTVPCVDENTAKATTCRFLPRSGRWLESTSGDAFAIAGQFVSRDGRRGGRYVVSSRLGKNGRPPCAKPKSQAKPKARAADSVGVVGTTDMGGGCTIEVNGSPNNALAAYGITMDNFATREVCTSSYPHPDGATLVRKPSPGVYCYTGRGAALNDSRGRERDERGNYLPGSHRCHVAWTAPPSQGGVEFFAAKRPNVAPYPAPGRVIATSPIVWRPVSRSVPVAN